MILYYRAHSAEEGGGVTSPWGHSDLCLWSAQQMAQMMFSLFIQDLNSSPGLV